MKRMREVAADQRLKRRQVVGYMTYTATENEHFPIPTLCAIYVRPEARGKGACKALMHDFIKASRTAKRSINRVDGVGDLEEAAVLGGDEGDVTEDDCEMYGIEAPVSKGTASVLMLTASPVVAMRSATDDRQQTTDNRQQTWLLRRLESMHCGVYSAAAFVFGSLGSMCRTPITGSIDAWACVPWSVCNLRRRASFSWPQLIYEWMCPWQRY